MTKLVVEEISSTNLSQNFTVPRRMTPERVRIYLYKHRSPSGSLTIELYQNGVKVGESAAVTSADIEANSSSTTTNFYHGYYSFIFTQGLTLQKGEFEVRLVPVGVTLSDSNWFGWVKPHDNIFPAINYTIIDDAYNPFGLEFWKWKGKMTRQVDIEDGYEAATEPTITSVIPTITGSVASPELITVAGITISDDLTQIIFVAGDGGAIEITNNPRITAPTVEGSTLILIGTNDTNTLTLTGDATLDTQGQTVTLYNGTAATFIYADTKWTLRALAE